MAKKLGKTVRDCISRKARTTKRKNKKLLEILAKDLDKLIKFKRGVN